MEECRKIPIENTWACNATCQHCYHFRHPNFKKKIHMPFESMVRIVDSTVETGGNHIYFVGQGEPTLHPQFDRILQYCKEKGLPTSVITNGTVGLDRYQNAYDSGLDHVHVSCHGVGDTLDRIMSQPGAHKRQLELKNWLRDNNLPWRSNTTVQKDNMNQLTEIAQENIDNNIFHFVFLHFLPHYEWKDHLKDHADLPEATAPKIVEAAELLLKSNTYLTIRYFPFCKIDSKWWKYITNAYYVAYDPFEWEYGLGIKPVQRIAENLRACVEIDRCKSCLAYRHCGGWNKNYDSAYGGLVDPLYIKDIPDEYKDVWDKMGGVFDLNPVNSHSGHLNV